MSSTAVAPPRVFISYSHDSAEHRRRALELSNRLREDGVDCHIDQYEVSPPEGWPRWMERRIQEADFVLIVCTEVYARRFAGTAPAGEGLGAKFEGAVITQTLYDAEMRNVKFIPLAFSAADADHCPKALRGATYYRVDEALGYENLYRHVTNQPAVIKPVLGTRRELPPQPVQPVLSNFSAPTGATLPASFENGLGMKFQLIPAGSFLMGSSDNDVRQSYDNAKAYDGKTRLEWFVREQPVHEVIFKNPFYMGKYPVTQAQWQKLMGNNPSHFKGNELPVESVSWDNVQIFLIRLNAQDETYSYRLPSEAEWEYACRAGTKTLFYFGHTITSKQANYDGRYPFFNRTSKPRNKTTKVGSFQHNLWGLCDMHGNVWEWCQDNWHDDYQQAPCDGSAWDDQRDDLRVVRGGAWSYHAWICRSADRRWFAQKNFSNAHGFRVVALKKT
jgi:formylglycine-generating enzyme required for sulfatase activity